MRLSPLSLLSAGVLLCVVCGGCSLIPRPLVSHRVDYSGLQEADLRGAAEAVEGAVKAGNRDFTPENRGEIVLDTPEIVQAVRTRAARAELVEKLLASGFAVEQRNGLISLVRGSAYKKATTSRDRDKNALVVMSENANRWTIYEGVLNASNLKSKALGAIQDAFYQARVAQLSPGTQYEDAGGNRTTK